MKEVPFTKVRSATFYLFQLTFLISGRGHDPEHNPKNGSLSRTLANPESLDG